VATGARIRGPVEVFAPHEHRPTLAFAVQRPSNIGRVRHVDAA